MDNAHHPKPEDTRGDPAGRPYLSQLAELFSSRGWLNRKLRISYQDQKYWLSCSLDSFCAYRVNEDGGVSPGTPGWPVCLVTKSHIVDESGLSDRSDLSDVPSPAPRARDWLSILSDGRLKLV